MATYVVTYDLNKEAKRPNILKDIKDFPGWAKLSESSYAISTTKDPEEIFDKLSEHLDGNDDLYVISISAPYFGQGQQEVIDWLSENLDA